MAAVTFSNYAQMRIKLNQYTTLEPLQAAIKVLVIVSSSQDSDNLSFTYPFYAKAVSAFTHQVSPLEGVTSSRK